MRNLRFLLFGTLFGVILTKAEVISWFRIQEMFMFQSVYMYCIIGSAVVVGALSVFLIKKFNLKTISGDPVVFPKKPFNKGVIFGGLIFGLGWAITGACPGPMFALIGNGYGVFIVTMVFALFSAWLYGYLQDGVPH